MKDYLGKDTFKLGFGLMRLPKNPDGSIDVPQTSKMVDLFMEAGGTYFDTAYVYDGGASEAATKLALVDRYPRESYTLATKLNAWLMSPTEEAAKQQFYTSLERTGAGYFDYYLLHALQDANYKIYEEYGLWDFVKGLKEQGLVKHYGFSFHASPELLEELLTAHPDVDFIQLQINYADWENPDVASRANLEVANRHGVPVTIMEPVKGGSLANPAKSVRDIFQAADPDASCASWAVRFAASQKGIITVLSGMSNIAQMEDNLSYMKEFRPLNEEEYAVIDKVREALKTLPTIPCTACHYCTDGCPMGIRIPEIFKIQNQFLGDLNMRPAKEAYAKVIQDAGKASDCIHCLQCESACPQQLHITEYLAECAANFE